MIPIYDRNPTRSRPVVTYLLIAANVVVFLWERALIAAGYSHLVFDWGLVPARFVLHPLAEIPNVFTSMFMHEPSSWWHVGGNMLFLWIFGDNVEDALGRWRYIGFYLLAGVVAAFVQVATGPNSVIPMIGASGAIAGVMAAYGVIHPRAPVVVINPILPLWLLFGPTLVLPAWFLVLEFLFLNLFEGLRTLGAATGGVAFFAHLGGFFAGYVMIRLWLHAGGAHRTVEPRGRDPALLTVGWWNRPRPSGEPLEWYHEPRNGVPSDGYQAPWSESPRTDEPSIGYHPPQRAEPSIWHYTPRSARSFVEHGYSSSGYSSSPSDQPLLGYHSPRRADTRGERLEPLTDEPLRSERDYRERRTSRPSSRPQRERRSDEQPPPIIDPYYRWPE